jgi:hypothetical protein
MPIARVQLEDGRIARIEVPEGTTPEDAVRLATQAAASAAPQQQQPKDDGELRGADYAKGLARTALQGLTFNFGDEIVAGARALNPFERKSYEQLRDEERASLARFAEQNPMTALGSEIAGGVVPSVAAMFVPGGQVASAAGASNVARNAGTLGRLARAAWQGSTPTRTAGKVGALTGAASGVGSAEEMGDAAGSGALGAMVGGGLGLAVPVAGKLAASGYQNVADRLNLPGADAAARARDYVLQMMSKSDNPITINDLRARIKADEKMGVPLGIQYQSPQLGRAFEVAALKSGAGEDLAEQAMRTNQGTVARTMQQLNKTLKPDDYFDAEDAIIEKMRKSAQPHYERAYALGRAVTETPELTALLNQPGAQKIWQEALSDPRYTLLGEKPGKEIWQDGRRVMEKPSLQTLDQFKRAIDRRIAELEAQPVKRGTVQPDLPGLRKFRSQYIEAVENALPKNVRDAWTEARSVYKGDAEIRDALRFGRDEFMSIEPQRLARTLADANTPLEQEAIRTGAFEALRRHYRAATQTLDPHDADRARAAASQIIGNPEIREKLQMIAPGPRDFRKLEEALMREGQIYSQNQRAVAGSPTARRLEASREFDQAQTGAAMLSDIAGFAANPSAPNLINKAQNVFSRIAEPEARARELARIFSGSTPQQIKDILDQLEKHQQRRVVQGARYQSAARGAPVVGTQTVVGQTPEDPEREDVTRDLRSGRF